MNSTLVDYHLSIYCISVNDNRMCGTALLHQVLSKAWRYSSRDNSQNPTCFRWRFDKYHSPVVWRRSFATSIGTSCSSSESSSGTNFAAILCMSKSCVRILWKESLLIPSSSPISHTVKRLSADIKVSTFSIEMSLRLVEGLPERSLLSTDVRPSLNRLNHSFIWVILIESSSKASWILRIVSAWVSRSKLLTKLDTI